MTTRLYLANTAATFTPTTKRGAWDSSASTLALALAAAKTGTSVAATQAETSATSNFDVLLGRWISANNVFKRAGSFAGTLQLTVARSETSVSANDFLHVHAFVTVGDTDVVRGTLITDDIDLSVELPSTLTAHTDTITMTSVSVLEGDRIVLEVGYQAQNTSISSFSATMQYGGTAADLATSGTTGVATNSPWAEFSDTNGLMVVANLSASFANPTTSSDALTKVIGKVIADTTTSSDALTGVKIAPPSNDTTTSSDAISYVKNNLLTLSDPTNSIDAIHAVMTRPEISNYQFIMDVDGTYPRVPWGYGQTISGGFAPGSFTVRDQDSEGVGDYMNFGTDKRTPPSWAWSLYTDVTDPGDALGWVDLMGQVWDHEVRKTPGGAIALRYKVADRIRRVYGRPRRFTPVPDRVQQGKVHIEADFQLIEEVFYDDDEQSGTVYLTSAVPVNTGSGIILPQALPWQFTEQASPQTGMITITGSHPTWVDAIFYGPSFNPYIQIGSRTYGLRGSIAFGQTVTISGKPWQMGVKRSDGAYMPGTLDPRARLSQLQLKPGPYAVTYGAVDATKSSRVELRWRQAHKTL